MYVPRTFSEPDQDRLFRIIDKHSFGLLISNTDEGPFATHLPWMLDRTRGPHGVLQAHMAKANPHWQQIRSSTPVLVVFQGPHGYISPAWYDNPELVPTWNYVAVHARGRLRMLDDIDERRHTVQALTERAESEFEEPWILDIDAGGREAMLEHIVAFEVEITELIGKTKLNQNRSAADRAGVVSQLEARNPALAEMMRLLD